MAFRKAVDDEDLDIYQMCAWVSRQDTINIPTKITYYAKAFICWSIQIVGLIVFLFVQLDPSLKDPSHLCAMNESTEGKYSTETQILATMFAFYISFKIGGTVFDIGRTGLYTINWWTGENCPPFVTRHWVFVGGYTNVWTSLASVIGSFLVLYISDDMLDVILNAVALFFINDIDDFMMNKKDYRRVREWFEEWEKKGERGVEHAKMGMMGSTVASKFCTPITICATFACLIIAVIAPFWIAICH